MTTKEGGGHQEYIEKVLHGTQQFLEDTLKENERLRGIVVSFESERLRYRDQILELRESVAKLELQQLRQQQTVTDFEVENQRVFAEFAEIEQQNSNLANLYVASYRLLGSVERAEVLQVIQEIIINLIGSEELGIYEVDEKTKRLTLLSSFGLEGDAYSRILNDSPIARAAETGEMYLIEPPPNNTSAPVTSLTACIPLKANERVIGVIAVFRMLPQKPALAAIDRELFELLGSHAAMALYCSGLHGRLRGGS
jgi:hypothetical protein